MPKAHSDKNGKVYVAARIPVKLKKKLVQRATRLKRSEAFIIEELLTKELATEEIV